MAQITRRLPFYDFRDWLMDDERLVELLHAEERNVFYPAAQQPEGGFPYVLYNVRPVRILPEWWMREEFVTMEIFMEDIEDSTEVINIIVEKAARFDMSARALQSWVREQAAENDRPQDFQYHYIVFNGGGDMSPPNEEGAVHGRVLSFGIVYSPLNAPGIV